MKKVLTTLTFVFCGLFLFAQIQVPQAVTQAFKDSHQTHDWITWTMEGPNYKAKSTGADNIHYNTVYDPAGTLLRSEHELAPLDVPPAITTFFNTNFPVQAAYVVWKVEAQNGDVTYYTNYNNNIYHFDSAGNLLGH